MNTFKHNEPFKVGDEFCGRTIIGTAKCQYMETCRKWCGPHLLCGGIRACFRGGNPGGHCIMAYYTDDATGRFEDGSSRLRFKDGFSRRRKV